MSVHTMTSEQQVDLLRESYFGIRLHSRDLQADLQARHALVGKGYSEKTPFMELSGLLASKMFSAVQKFRRTGEPHYLEGGLAAHERFASYMLLIEGNELIAREELLPNIDHPVAQNTSSVQQRRFCMRSDCELRHYIEELAQRTLVAY